MFSQPQLYRQERGLTVKLDESKSSGFPIRSKLDTTSSASSPLLGIDANKDWLYTLDWTSFWEDTSELFFRCIAISSVSGPFSSHRARYSCCILADSLGSTPTYNGMLATEGVSWITTNITSHQHASSQHSPTRVSPPFRSAPNAHSFLNIKLLTLKDDTWWPNLMIGL